MTRCPFLIHRSLPVGVGVRGTLPALLPRRPLSPELIPSAAAERASSGWSPPNALPPSNPTCLNLAFALNALDSRHTHTFGRET